MPITFKTEQLRDQAVTAAKIADTTIVPGKLDLTDTYNFASGTLRAATPSNSADVATKSYVDGVAQGLFWKDSCRLASAANFASTYNNGAGTLTASATGALSIDGVAVASDNRILIKNQTDGVENGIYTVTNAGGVGVAAVLTRASDMDAAAEFPGAAVFVQAGNTQADSGYVCTNDSVTVGTTEITFVQFTGAGQITAGDGLAKSGDTLSVVVDDSSIAISNDTLGVKALGITNAMLAGSIADSKLDTIATANKVSGSAVQLASSNATLENSTGLRVRVEGPGGIEASSDGLRVKLDSNPGIESSTDGLKVKVKGSSGIILDGDGLSIGLGNGLAFDSGAIRAIAEGGTLSVSANGIKVSDDGITGTQFGMVPRSEKFTSAAAAHNLAAEVHDDHLANVRAFLNGQRIEFVSGSDPSDVFQYKVTKSGSTTTVTLGAALASGDVLICDYHAG